MIFDQQSSPGWAVGMHHYVDGDLSTNDPRRSAFYIAAVVRDVLNSFTSSVNTNRTSFTFYIGFGNRFSGVSATHPVGTFARGFN
ncbi:hypothetical protein HMEPL2_29710 [Vreelandella aquamarina]|uniref:Uncharacterized protein n=1 Tax=Vreelandella aquamarina TaxID=77097 RepID=A0A6F8XGJ5_9GAMM|nr:hypothetical protein HMEPL2_29710 [Halomonas meridiana]